MRGAASRKDCAVNMNAIASILTLVACLAACHAASADNRGIQDSPAGCTQSNDLAVPLNTLTDSAGSIEELFQQLEQLRSTAEQDLAASLANSTEAHVEFEIREAKKRVSLTFNSAIEQLLKSADADTNSAIMWVTREAAASVKHFTDRMVNVVDADVRLRIAMVISSSTGLFGCAIMQLPNAADADTKSAIVGMLKEAAASVRGLTDRIIKEAQISVRRKIACGIRQVVEFFKNSIAKLPNAGTDVRTTIMDMVREAAATVRVLTDRMANEEDLRWGIADVIGGIVNVFGSAISCLPNAADIDTRNALVDMVREAAVTVRVLTDRMANEADVRWGIAHAIGRITYVFRSALWCLSNAADINIKNAIAEVVFKAVTILEGLAYRMADDECSEVRERIADAISITANLFGGAFAPLRDAASSDARNAILEVVREAAAIVESLTWRMANEKLIAVKLGIVNAIKEIATIFRIAVLELSNATDVGRRDAILEAVREAGDLVRELTRRMTAESNAAMRAGIAGAIRAVVAVSFKGIIVLQP